MSIWQWNAIWLTTVNGQENRNREVVHVRKRWNGTWEFWNQEISEDKPRAQQPSVSPARRDLTNRVCRAKPESQPCRKTVWPALKAHGEAAEICFRGCGEAPQRRHLGRAKLDLQEGRRRLQ